MTTFDAGVVRTLATAQQGDAIRAEALHTAIRRDLGRLGSTLAAPVTAVRRGALIEHTLFLLDEILAHHRSLDEACWPAVLTVRPELTDLAERVKLAHRELAQPITAVRNASLRWRGDPGRRLNVLSVVRELAAAVSPVLDQDTDLARLIDEVLDAGGTERSSTAGWAAVAPTKLARRTFWLLDDLDPRQAELLTARSPRVVMWILRNGFSGAYNRSAYLMWVGGGTGPAT